MQWNGIKFVHLSIGPNEELKQIPLFTPKYESVIDWKEAAKDLGILIDCNNKFVSHRNSAIKKTSQKCSWIL